MTSLVLLLFLFGATSGQFYIPSKVFSARTPFPTQTK